MTDLQDQIKQMGFDAVMTHNLSEVVRITRETTIEECAKIAELYKHDEPETVRMVNYRAAIAERIRALIRPQPDGAMTRTERLSPHNEFNPQREYPGSYGRDSAQSCSCQHRAAQLPHLPGCPLSRPHQATGDSAVTSQEQKTP